MSKDSSRDLVRLTNYPGWYIVPATGQLVFRTTFNGRRLKIRTGIEGKLNKKTGICEGITAARRVVDEHLEGVRTGKTGVELDLHVSGVTNPSVDSVWQILFSEKTVGKSPGTIRNYQKNWKHGLRGFWGVPPENPSELAQDRAHYPTSIPRPPYMTADRVNDVAIVQYKAWYLENRGDKLFEKTFDFLKMLLTFGVNRGFFKKFPDISPLEDIDEIVKKATRYQKAGRVYTKDEQRRLLDAWKEILKTSDGTEPSRQRKILAARSRAFLAIGLLGGVRYSELSRLEKSKVDFKNGSLKVWSFKNHHWRDVPLVDEAREALVFQIEANEHLNSKWLFPAPNDPTKTLSHGVFEKTWYRTREIAKIEDIGPYEARYHDCRKTFATMTAELGWPPKVACEIMDMSLDVYERVYVSQISLEVKQAFMKKSFGGAR